MTASEPAVPAGPPAGTVTLFVCVSCRAGAEGGPPTRPGPDLVDLLQAGLGPDDGIRVEPVDCLAVCKRPCTVALAMPGCWTYVIGDIDPVQGGGDVLDAARRYRASGNGIVPWRERPAFFRRGVVARIPPVPG